VTQTLVFNQGTKSVHLSFVGMPLCSQRCDVVSSFLCHTHTDGKDKLLEWPDRSSLLLYVSTRIH